MERAARVRKSVISSKCFRNQNESQLDLLPYAYVSHGAVLWLQAPALRMGEVRQLFLPQHSVMVGSQICPPWV